MKKKKQDRRAPVTHSNSNSNSNSKMSIISLGKPEPVLTTGTDYQEIWYDNDFDHYSQPIDRLALAQLVNLNGQHGGVLYARRNMVAADYVSGGLSHEELKAGVFDYLTFGDVAIAKVRNGWGEVVALAPLPSLYLRVRKDDSIVILQKGEPLVFNQEEVIYLKQYDPQQQVYGLPPCSTPRPPFFAAATITTGRIRAGLSTPMTRISVPKWKTRLLKVWNRARVSAISAPCL